MAENHAIPSRDPADDGTLMGTVKLVLDKFLSQVDDMLPARVISYDRTTNRAAVVPMIRLLTTTGQQVGRAQVASVPVLRSGAGGVVLSFHVQPGDLGWIKANDRDISLMLQAYSDSAPNTLRKHSFQDALFIPDAMTGVTIAAEDQEHAVLQTFSGDTRLSVWDEFIKVFAQRGLLVSDEPGESGENCILDTFSTVRGARPWPRMTTAERDAIPVTEDDEGLVIWNLDTHGINTFNGTTWG